MSVQESVAPCASLSSDTIGAHHTVIHCNSVTVLAKSYTSFLEKGNTIGTTPQILPPKTRVVSQPQALYQG